MADSHCPREIHQTIKKAETLLFRLFRKKLAATYSRGVYKTTTIGKTVFDGRVRNGNGSDHSFMATKMLARTAWRLPGGSIEIDGAKNLKEQDRNRRIL